MRLDGLRKALATFDQRVPTGGKIMLLICFAFIGSTILGIIFDKPEGYAFTHLSPAGHLKRAQEICHSKEYEKICVGDTAEACRHLQAIPTTAAEYLQAVDLLNVIAQQDERIKERQRQQGISTGYNLSSSPETEQKKRDEDAQLNSYWPTTIRVDTDIDSFWLNNE